ncbi:MAG: baseplate J/gp47 family protein [Bacteroidota bacterium]
MRLIHVPRLMSMTRLIKLMAAAGLEQIVLRVPWGARACRDALDLDLLALYAREHQIRLVLVSRDSRVLRLAAAAGIEASTELPVELITLGADDQTAASSERPPAPLAHLPLWSLVGIFLAVVAGSTILLWPRSVVTVVAARRQLEVTARALVAPSFREGQIPEGRLPARVLSKSDLIVVEVPASGSKMVGVTPAEGSVTLLNDGPDRLVVPAGTIVQGTTGARYRLPDSITVPAAKSSFLLGVKVGTTSGQADARVVAEEPGSAGNLAPGKIASVIGPLGRMVKVVNTGAISGGTDKRMTVVSEGDLERARLEARRQMELKAPEELRSLAGTEQILLMELMAVAEGHWRETPGVGTVAETVRVALPYSVRCLVLARTTLAKFLEEQARRRVPASFEVTREPFTVQELRAVPKRPEEAELEVTATYTATGRLERGRILAALRGRPVEEARKAILGLPEVGSVQMNLAPGARFPRYAWMIKVVLSGSDERQR